MKRVRFAIGTKDGKEIFQGHLGDSKIFLIYDIEDDGNIELIEERKNISPKKDAHGSDNKMTIILSILKDCNILISKRLSPNFKKISLTKPLQPIMVKRNTIEEAITVLKNHLQELFEMVGKRIAGERSEHIPKWET